MKRLNEKEIAMVSGGWTPLTDSQLSNIYISTQYNPYWFQPFTFYNLRNW